MTQKHFKALAYELMTVRPEIESLEYHQWLKCVWAVASVCGDANSRFNHELFERACKAEKYTPAMHGK